MRRPSTRHKRTTCGPWRRAGSSWRCVGCDGDSACRARLFRRPLACCRLQNTKLGRAAAHARRVAALTQKSTAAQRTRDEQAQRVEEATAASAAVAAQARGSPTCTPPRCFSYCVLPPRTFFSSLGRWTSNRPALSMRSQILTPRCAHPPCCCLGEGLRVSAACLPFLSRSRHSLLRTPRSCRDSSNPTPEGA